MKVGLKRRCDEIGRGSSACSVGARPVACNLFLYGADGRKGKECAGAWVGTGGLKWLTRSKPLYNQNLLLYCVRGEVGLKQLEPGLVYPGGIVALAWRGRLA